MNKEDLYVITTILLILSGILYFGGYLLNDTSLWPVVGFIALWFFASINIIGYILTR